MMRDAAAAFVDGRTFSRAAALAYYTLFSLAPLLMISISFIGLIVDVKVARAHIVHELGGIIGGKSAQAIDLLLQAVATPGPGPAAVVGILALLIGATSVFAELKDWLDQIWGVPRKSTVGLFNILRKRLLSFGLVLAIGFLLLVSLLFSAAIAALQHRWLLSDSTGIVLELVNSLLSYVLVCAMFATIYRWLPGVRVAWRDVVVGTLITAGLFGLGKYLIGFYLGRIGVESAYGAAGSVILLLWVYYSAVISCWERTSPEPLHSTAAALCHIRRGLSALADATPRVLPIRKSPKRCNTATVGENKRP